MFYRLKEHVALRRWKYVDRAIYLRGVNTAQSASKEEFETLLLCDGCHDLPSSFMIDGLIRQGYIESCEEGEKPSEWSSLKEYPNYYFPMMNLMITGKCNLNCLHCFNAKDNAPLNTEWKYDELIHLLDEAKDIGVNAFTITGGEPFVHPRFMDIVKAIYQRNMFIFELNTNGLLITPQILDEFIEIGCKPLMKISFDGVGYHNWIRQHPKAEEKTIEAIKLCISKGFRVLVQTQVNRKNLDSMLETAKLLDSLGVSIMRIIRTTEAPRWESNAPNGSLTIEEYYEKMLEFAKEFFPSRSKMEVIIWQFMTLHPSQGNYHLDTILCNPKEFNIRIPMCKGTRGMIGVTSGGDVVPCLQMSGYFMQKGKSLGNVHTTPLKDLVRESDYTNLAMAPLLKKILENDKCANCKYFKNCAGGCPALGLLYSSGDKPDYFHEDIAKCLYFENGWYEKTLEALEGYDLLNPLDLEGQE